MKASLRKLKRFLEALTITSGVNTDPIVESCKRLSGEWKAILERSVEKPIAVNKDQAKTIVCLTGNGLNAKQLSVETVVLSALRERGCNVRGLICKSAVPSCEFNIYGSGTEVDSDLPSWSFGKNANEMKCRNCAIGAELAYSGANLPLEGLAKYSEDSDFECARKLVKETSVQDIRSKRLNGIGVGDHAFSSTLRITFRGTVDFDNPAEVAIYRRQFLSAILMSLIVSRALDKLNPDVVLAVHGVYLTHGTLVDVCKVQNRRCVIWGVPYRSGTLWLSHRETYHRTLIEEPKESFMNLELSTIQREMLWKYIRSKEAGGRDHVNYHPSPILDAEVVLRELGLDPKKPIVSLYTNVIWDAQILYQFNVFADIFEWVFETISYYSSRPEVQLVIRIHPAESKGGFVTNQPLAPEILKRFPVLPKNVFLVDASSNLSSYTIAEMSKATLIYGTKLGLELAARNIPVIVAGETFNRGKGYTFDAKTREEYFALLDSADKMERIPEEMSEIALKFAYHLFFRRMLDFPLLCSESYGAIAEEGKNILNFQTLKDLRIGQNKNLDAICDGIVDGKPFVGHVN